MLQILFALILIMHGIGHAVGFWMPVPPWFALLWTLPGIGFLAGAWGYWHADPWWPAVVVLAALASFVVLTFPTGVLRLAPFRAALIFDMVAIAAISLPWSRQLVSGL